MNNLLRSQARLSKAEDVLRTAKEKHERAQARVDALKEEHREQIKRSLQSRDPEEQEMARGVATFWEIPLPA